MTTFSNRRHFCGGRADAASILRASMFRLQSYQALGAGPQWVAQMEYESIAYAVPRARIWRTNSPLRWLLGAFQSCCI